MGNALAYLGKFLLWCAILVATVLALYAGWSKFLASESKMHRFWTVSRPHYKLTFSIGTPDGKFTAETVVEVEYMEIPQWERDPFLGLGQGFHTLRELNGHAAALRMPDGKAVVMGLSGKYDVTKLVDLLLTNSPLWYSGGIAYPRVQVTAYNASQFHGGAEIPPDLLPWMLVFTDADNPHTAHVFDPAAPGHWLGAGVTFAGARIEFTNEPVGSKIAALLPWLQTPEPKNSREADRYADTTLTTPDDPYWAETHGAWISRRQF